jgi:predicted ATPase
VVAKTDGVPLFVEELTKMGLESELLQEREERYELTGPLPPLAIPATLHDSLMARLDRLATVKALAQLGATLGREFSYELLQAVAPWDEATMQQGLSQLVEAEFLYQQGLPPQATYRFKHALIRDVAYQALLRSTRQQYHQHIAQVLAEQFPETAEIQPELLAQHYTEAGLSRQAVSCWQRAGQRAIERSADVEAITHLTQALELLTTLPETPERIEQELALHIALGAPLTAVKGMAAPEVERTYIRARELCQQVGETPQLFPVLWGLWVFYNVRGEHQVARALTEQFLALAQSLQDPAFLLEAHRTRGVTLFFLGEFASARTHLEQGMALYDPYHHGSHTFMYGYNPKVVCLSFEACALWLLGYPDQAVQRSYEALTLAQTLSHSHSLALALCFVTFCHQFCREGRLAQERAEALMTLSQEQGFPFWLASGMFQWGWALAEQGQIREGMAPMHQVLATWQAMGVGLWSPYCFAMLGKASGQGGQVEEGLSLLAEGLATVHKTGEHLYEAEVYRLKGELLLQQSTAQQGEAEEHLQQALAVARHQQAKSWELRAAMSLSRLWQQQGKRAEAYDLLAPIYGWFTEGFDTADLQEAKALLDELS